MSGLSIFNCITCGRIYEIQEIRYRCECGDLLEVIHDFSTSIPNVEKWKCSMDNKIGETAFIRYKDILFPSMPKENIITLKEGDTPLYDVSNVFHDFGSLKLKHE